MGDVAKPEPTGLLCLDLLHSMIGHRLTGVEYKTSRDFSADDTRGETGDVQEIDQAVLLSVGSAAIALEWCIRNYDEYVNIACPPSAGVAASVLEVIDVSGTRQWRALLGARIVDFGLATQRSEEGRLLPWAVRITVDSGASVVVGLGELREHVPSYQPDSLVAIFDQRIARSYKLLDAPESAWGKSAAFYKR